MGAAVLWRLAGIAANVRCVTFDAGAGRLAVLVERGDSALLAEIHRDVSAARVRAFEPRHTGDTARESSARGRRAEL